MKYLINRLVYKMYSIRVVFHLRIAGVVTRNVVFFAIQERLGNFQKNINLNITICSDSTEKIQVVTE